MENMYEVIKGGLLSDNEEVVRWTINVLREEQVDFKLIMRAVEKHPGFERLLMEFVLQDASKTESILESMKLSATASEHIQQLKTVFSYILENAKLRSKVLF